MNKEKGFTFIEVMIALAVLAGVVVTVLSTLNHHLGVAGENSDIVTASILGREKAEEISLYGLPKIMEGAFTEEEGRFRWIVAATDTEVVTVRKVDVRVLWGSDREVLLVSYIKK